MNMKKVCLAVLICAAFCSVRAQLTDICLVTDIEPYLGLFVGGAYNVDSARLNGGTCDSVSLSMYMGGIAFPVPLIITKQDSCTLKLSFVGLFDTTFNACPASPVRPARSPAALAPRNAGAVLDINAVGLRPGAGRFDIRGRACGREGSRKPSRQVTIVVPYRQ